MCNEKLDWIKIITVSTPDSGNTGQFTHIVNNMPSPPDECIIKAVSYNAVVANDYDGVFMIWSDLINDIIVGFSGRHTGTTFAPNIRIPLNRGWQGNELKFQVFVADHPKAIPFSFIPGEISITMEFIKYADRK